MALALHRAQGLWPNLFPCAARTLAIAVFFFSVSVQAEQICPRLSSDPALDPPLSDVELRMVCGDPQAPQEAWKSVPAAQARYFLRIFLEDRGLFHPVIHESAGGKLELDPGPVTRITALELTGGQGTEAVEIGRKRDVVDQILTPAALDQVSSWVTQRLSAVARPCGSASATADPETGELRIAAEPGLPRFFPRITGGEPEGTDPGVLSRYYAFREGDPYNGDYLRLSAERMVTDGVVLSAAYTPDCSSDPFRVRQEIIAGQPRLLSFGFGANTEGLLLLRASWRNSRLGRRASILDVSAFASTRLQSLRSTVEWHLLADAPRAFLKPSIEFRHENEAPYEILSARTEVMPALLWDGEAWGARLESGPVWSFVRTLRGTGPKSAHILSLAAHATATSHYFEFYRVSPRTGFTTEFFFDANQKGILSDVTAQSLRWTGEILWNWRLFDPPLWVFGLRWGLLATFAPGGSDSLDLLPPNYLHYLGGSADLRGFGRNELPRGRGALGAGFLGFEARLSSGVPWGIQPIVFVDLGKLGLRSPILDPPLYWSPGFGLRWQSPIGSIRATAARGMASGIDAQDAQAIEHWQLYFSLGEEF